MQYQEQSSGGAKDKADNGAGSSFVGQSDSVLQENVLRDSESRTVARANIYSLDQFYGEDFHREDNILQVSSSTPRSVANERRGTKSPNLYAVVSYNRRVGDRRSEI